MKNVSDIKLDYKSFKKIIDNTYDEIFVYDNNYKVVYVNKASKRHYGYQPKEIIGKDFHELVNENYWDISILPYVYRDKKEYAIKQYFQMGVYITTIATPIFDKHGDIEYVVMSVRDRINTNAFNTESTKSARRINKSLIFSSNQMKDVLESIEKIKDIESNVILIGESGTGKTIIAKYIHDIGLRKNNPFITVNCAAIPYELMETELFGYAKGAFTGAKPQGHEGAFLRANKGTILLDEISELSYGAQAKLLQVIQDKEFTPIGGNNPIKVDVRIIAATNKNLIELTESGKFRLDLFYRLNIFEISIPPLRERKDDIEILIQFFINQFNTQYNKSHQISDNAVDILKNYHWKGNVRELRHLIERLVVTIDDIIIESSHLPRNIFQIFSYDNKSDNTNINLEKYLKKIEKNIIIKTFNKYKSTRKVAKVLSISQTKSSRLIKEYLNE